jgi:hypothetical protein
MDLAAPEAQQFQFAILLIRDECRPEAAAPPSVFQ